ncbi:MAG: hypothetical protein GY933_05580 [Hyphomicrobiales bacterium]|nr:hypothetical protein [Hyphomicrobiales bacterium]
MKTLLLMICAVLVSAPAFAMNQYNINNMTCSQVQSTLKRDGQAQLRYTSPRNVSLTLYDRFVSGGNYCRPMIVYVPTRDTKKCKVRKCQKYGGR